MRQIFSLSLHWHSSERNSNIDLRPCLTDFLLESDAVTFKCNQLWLQAYELLAVRVFPVRYICNIAIEFFAALTVIAFANEEAAKEKDK